MLNYLKNSEVSLRIGLNPFNWKWIPSIAYDAPTAFYPKRRTYAVIWLGLQLYLDVDNGDTDLSSLRGLFAEHMDIADEQPEVGHTVSQTRKRSSLVE